MSHDSDSLAPSQQARFKHLDALRRAIPVTRMVDYGVPLGDALGIHAQTAGDAPMDWDLACEQRALRYQQAAARAEQAGHRLTAAHAWRAAAALLQCGQLAFNEDRLRKLALYEQAHEAMVRHAGLSGDLDAIGLSTPLGTVYGWVVRPTDALPRAAVLVLGGLSGWGAAYLDMGRALAARGVLAILGEGPGQGLTRMRGGPPMRADNLSACQAFLDYAQQAHGADRLGVWGNSFGGLLAARVALADARVRALCVNGAAARPAVPGFRTAREQMQAAFGVDTEDGLAACLRGLAIAPGPQPLAASVLVAEGGCDPLVAPGEQDAFLALAASGRGHKMHWADGEHTIYNHAVQRNHRIADWFAEQLQAAGTA